MLVVGLNNFTSDLILWKLCGFESLSSRGLSSTDIHHFYRNCDQEQRILSSFFIGMFKVYFYERWKHRMDSWNAGLTWKTHAKHVKF